MPLEVSSGTVQFAQLAMGLVDVSVRIVGLNPLAQTVRRGTEVQALSP
jgi:hypothetical protein